MEQNNIERKKKMNKQNMKKILAIGVLAVAVVVVALLGFFLREKTQEGSKSIVIEVTDSKKVTKEYELKTDAEYLRQAMEEAGITFSGAESEEFGMMVDTVNGERADYTLDNAYWSFNVNGEYCNYGIDTQPVKDGDEFQIIYTPANMTE